MVNRCLIVFFSLFLGISVFGQNEWAPVGTTWSFTTELCGQPNCGYYTLESTKDTLINGKTTKHIKLTEYGEGSLILEKDLFMYKEGDNIFNYETVNNEFYKLYDFSLEVGDTLVIQDTLKSRGYENIIGEQEIPFFAVRIDSISEISINDSVFKVQHTSPLEESEFKFKELIIENIGSLGLNIIGETKAQPTIYHGGLRCYESNEIFYNNLDGENCSLANITSYEQSSDNFEVYPNPASSKVTVKLSTQNENSLVKYILLDLSGKTVQSGIVENQEIDVSLLNAGYYVIQVEVNEEIYSKPLVVD